MTVITDAPNSLAGLLRPEVLAISAYHVQPATGFIKLDAMENPYQWPEAMQAEWLDVLKGVGVNRYPDPGAEALRSALRRANDLPDSVDLMLGNGSDELIQIILMAVKPDTTVLAPHPTFVMYRQIAASLGLKFVGVDLQEADFSLDMDAMREAIAVQQPGVIFLAYPNNPTGNAFARKDVLEILSMAKGLVILDEAYAPFADDSFMGDLSQFPNLLVMRTLSKWGLAGLRLGYMAGNPAWIAELDKVRLPYNINILTQVTAEFALSKQAVLQGQIESLRRDRAILFDQLSALPVQVFASQANFITFRLMDREADAVFEGLKQGGVLIKNLSPSGGALRQCLRVTVGTPEENQRFIEVLSSLLQS